MQQPNAANALEAHCAWALSPTTTMTTLDIEEVAIVLLLLVLLLLNGSNTTKGMSLSTLLPPIVDTVGSKAWTAM